MNITYKLLAAAFAAPLLAGCIEEVEPTNGIIQNQLEGSSKATEALVYAMPSQMNTVGTVDESQAYDWGNPSLMHIRDVMTEDMAITSSGYNWFSTWSQISVAVQDGYMATQFIWTYYCKQILTCNNVIKAIDPETEDEYLRSYLGAGYAFRASTYLDMGRMYEFLPNNYVSGVNTQGKDVTGLTVPIITENTTEEESRNNPRVDHNALFKFIMEDLDNAVRLLTDAPARSSKTVPNLAVAYGLMARAYLWDASYQKELGDASQATQNFAKAAEYAAKAIAQSGATPMNQQEWLSTTAGFNDLSVSSWLWGSQYVAEDRAVTSALLNWTSWMSNETDFGYASAGPLVHIGASLYDNINDRDFRKLAFVAPEGSACAGRESFIDASWAADALDEYCSLKFRPGSGNMYDNKVACAVGVPLMRVEEMYMIEAEATAYANPAAGLQILKNFMTSFRYPTYNSTATSVEDVVKEVILQKRIELWGEGQSYFDAKRLGTDVTRYYDGTNFAAAERFNTNGRAPWMNFVITRQETRNNKAITDYNNPSPYQAITPAQ